MLGLFEIIVRSKEEVKVNVKVVVVVVVGFIRVRVKRMLGFLE